MRFGNIPVKGRLLWPRTPVNGQGQEEQAGYKAFMNPNLIVIPDSRSRKTSNRLSSASSSRQVAARIVPWICAGLRAPTIAAVTAGCRSVQAIATSAGRFLVCRADCAQQLHQLQVGAPASRHENCGAACENHCPANWRCARASSCRSTCRWPWESVRQHSNAVALAIRQCFSLNVTPDERIRRLQGRNRAWSLFMRSICPELKLDTPAPANLAFALLNCCNVSQASSMSGSGSGQWIW